jgi:hypothetical protein
MTGIRCRAEAKDFSSNLCVQTSSEAHPASCTMGTGCSLPGVKRGLGVTLTTHPHLVPRSRMSRSHTFPPWCLHGGSGTAFTFIDNRYIFLSLGLTTYEECLCIDTCLYNRRVADVPQMVEQSCATTGHKGIQILFQSSTFVSMPKNLSDLLT